MSIVVVIPFTHADASLAVDMLHWMRKLGGCGNFDCLLVNDIKVHGEAVEAVMAAAKRVFKQVWSVHTPFELPDERWPLGANHVFETTLRAMEPMRRPFLWLEPDCVPLRTGWLEMIDAVYKQAGKPFMGQLIAPGKADLPPVVMSGIAVYPPDAGDLLLKAVVQFKGRQAFDIAMAGITVGRCAQTRLIHNFYGEKGLPPTFDLTKRPGRNVMKWTDIPRQAVLFHRCKDGSLIALLRRKLRGVVEAPALPAPALPPLPPAPVAPPLVVEAPSRPRRGPKQIHLGTPNLRGQVDGTSPVVEMPPEG